MLIKLTVDLFNRYIEKRAKKKVQRAVWLKILISFLVYAPLAVPFVTAQLPTEVLGILCQIQVIIAVSLVISLSGVGYIAAMIMSLISCFFATHAVWSGRTEALPGIFVHLSSFIILTIVYFFSSRLNRKISELSSKNGELTKLYHDLAAAESQYWIQSKRLEEFNRIVADNQRKFDQVTLTDMATGLPNRRKIVSRINMMIDIAEKKSIGFSVLLIHFNNFRTISDTAGYERTDAFLSTVMSKLKTHVHPSDMLGRLSGSDFVVLVQRELSGNDLAAYAESLRDVLTAAVRNNQLAVSLSLSFGIAGFPNDGTSASDLLKCADIAMSEAKSCGGNAIRLFSNQMRLNAERQNTFRQKLACAAENNELFLMFQPQFNIQSGHIRGLEALVRWHSPELGLIRPGEFVETAEKSGIIVSMGEWILRKSCEVFQNLHISPTVLLIVNISHVQLAAPDFVQTVSAILEETGLNGSRIEFDITGAVSFTSDAVSGLHALKRLGIRIALDDFGTKGALSCLQTLPIDTLKMDKSFIDGMMKKPYQQIVLSVISLVHELGLTVVAKGVEHERQLHRLKQYGCDCVQGFLLSQPVTPEALNRLLPDSL